MIIKIVIALVILISAYLYFTREKRAIKKAGTRGERKLYKELKRSVGKNAKVLRNVVLPLYEETTEIDMLVICKSGIVIIENKHLSGTVVGKPWDDNWSQTKNGYTKEFYNPLKQNNGHFKCMIHHLKKNKLGNIPLFSLVIFSHDNIELQVNDPKVLTFDKGIREVSRIASQRGNICVTDLTESVKSFSKKYA